MKLKCLSSGSIGNCYLLECNNEILILDCGISIKDKDLGIDWHIPIEEAILSEKDLKHACLEDFDTPFDYNTNLYPEFE
jgi:Cft2 family RNA processing exonuclease